MSSPDKTQMRPLILDIGSNTFRMGWAGEDFPDIIAPSVYVDVSDYLFTSDVIDGLEDIYIKEEKQNHLVGHEALKYQDILKIHEFKKEGNYNILTKFFFHYYNQLNVAPELQYQQPLVIILPFFSTDLEKTKLQDIFFDRLNFPAILFIDESQAILSTLQKTSGVVINIGESYTYISTIFHGFTNIMARDLFPVAGKELTNHLLNLILAKKGLGRNVFVNKSIAEEIKERLSLCLIDPNNEKTRVKEGLTKYDRIIDLPDSSKLKINLERFMLAEPLFNPRLIHIDYIGLAEAVSKVIKTWERENWEALVSNIILAGGSSLIPGLNQRLELELKQYFSERLKPKLKVIAASGRENMGWIGASILYSGGKLQKGWIKNPNLEKPLIELNHQKIE
jgi:actin-related protein